MDIHRYLAALRKSWWIVLAVVVLAGAAGTAAYLLTPAVYASKVTFYVSTPMPAGTNPQSAGQFAQSRVSSYVQLLNSERLAKAVVSDMRLAMTAQEVAKEIVPTAQTDTVLVTATVNDTSAPRSLLIARGLAVEFPKMVDLLDNQGRSDAIVVINTVSGPSQIGRVAPSIKKYVGLSLLAGILLGMVIALAREVLDNTVRSIEMVRSLVNAPVVGTIDFDASSKKAPLILGDQTGSIRAESYRQLRTNLQFIDAAETAGVLLVTSAVPGEGKSTTAVNLALSFVEFGERVLIVEADLRRPKVAGYLGLERQIGLTNVLVGQVDVDEVIQGWGERLAFLASGSIPPNPSELLGGAKMALLMSELRGRYDKIIIDAPPVLPVTDAAVASSIVDGVVFVVRAGRTTRTQVSGAARSLHNVGARIVGSVLSMRKPTYAERHRYGADAYYGSVAMTASEEYDLEVMTAREETDAEDKVKRTS